MSWEDTRREALRLKMERRPLGASGRIAKAFLDSKLTPLLVVASLLLGAFGLLVTPREEEPQIKVPMIDLIVTMPASFPSESTIGSSGWRLLTNCVTASLDLPACRCAFPRAWCAAPCPAPSSIARASNNAASA